MLVRFQSIVVRWKLFYLYTVFLILLSVLPINSISGSSINHIFVVSIRLDYFLHGLIYVPLVFVTWTDRDIDTFTMPFKALVWIMILLLFAAVTEWIQYFLPYRAFNINDLMANITGVLIGLILIVFVEKINKQLVLLF